MIRKLPTFRTVLLGTAMAGELLSCTAATQKQVVTAIQQPESDENQGNFGLRPGLLINKEAVQNQLRVGGIQFRENIQPFLKTLEETVGNIKKYSEVISQAFRKGRVTKDGKIPIERYGRTVYLHVRYVLNEGEEPSYLLLVEYPDGANTSYGEASKELLDLLDEQNQRN